MNKFDIILVDLNPVKGSEQSGIRPCIILQNNYANKVARTFVIAIISSTLKTYPHTIIVDPSRANNLSNTSRIDLLQIRTIDEERIIKTIGTLDTEKQFEVDTKLRIAFAC